MGYLKNEGDLFLGSAEITKFQNFLDAEGWRKFMEQLSLSYGIVHNIKKQKFTNGLVEVGTNAGTIKINPLLAIDSDYQFIRKAKLEDNIPLANNNRWYWVKIKFTNQTIEEGRVNILSDGSISGTDTLFTKLLRGGPNFMSNIRFPESSINTGIYQVIEVIDDINLILNGKLREDNNQKYTIAGTFSPGVPITKENRDPFQYDGVELSLEVETELETEPEYVEGKEFYLARVRNSEGIINIQDVRTRFLYQTKADWNLTNVDNSNNNLIGVEAIKYDNIFTPRAKNIVYVGWGFRCSNWTIDSSSNKITLHGGEGGRFKSSDDFQEGNFDGWRIYTEDGSYQIIQSSGKSPSQINLILDSLDFAKYESNSNQELIIVPNADEIKIIFSTKNNEKVKSEFFAPINQRVGKFPLTAYRYNQESKYIIQYQNKLAGVYGPLNLIPSDLEQGYYNEDSFDEEGNLKLSSEEKTRITYFSSLDEGFIYLQLADNAYRNVIDNIERIEAVGVETRNLVNATPLIELTPGINSSQQFFDQREGNFNLTTEHYINITTKDIEDNVIIKDGVGFYLQINSGGNAINLNSQTFKIVTGYKTPGDIGEEIFNFSQEFLDRAKTNNARLRIYYDKSNDEWLTFIYNPVSLIGTNLIEDLSITTGKLADSAVTVGKLGVNLAGNGLSQDSTTKKLSVNVDDSTIVTVAGNLQIKDDGVKAKHLNSDIVVKNGGLDQDSNGALQIKDDGVTPAKLGDIVDATTNGGLIKSLEGTIGIKDGGVRPKKLGRIVYSNNGGLIQDTADADADVDADNFATIKGKLRVNVDNSSININVNNELEIYNSGVSAAKLGNVVASDGGLSQNNGALQIKDDGVSAAKLGNVVASDGGLSQNNGALQIKDDGVSAAKLGVNLAGDGLSQDSTTKKLSVNVDGSTIVTVDGNLQIKDDGVTVAKLGNVVASDGGLIQNDGALQLDFNILENKYISNTNTEDNIIIKTKRIEIGPWDMRNVSYKGVNHGLSTLYKNIISINVMIRNNDNTIIKPLLSPNIYGDGKIAGAVGPISNSSIGLYLYNGLDDKSTGFVNNNYRDNGKYNRGYIYLTYFENP